MIDACQIFDLYRNAAALREDDCADFLVIAQDINHPTDSCMAISGLTLALLEHEWNKERFLLLLKAYSIAADDMARERIVVGVLMVMLKYNLILRENVDLHEAVQDVLTDDPELCYTALCNIARTSKVKQLESFNQQMTKDIMPLMNQVGSDEFYEVIRKHQGEMEKIARMHLDQNFLVFKTAYYTDFFRSHAAHWFRPWSNEQLLNLPEEQREQVQQLIDVWSMCDSDKYALMGMSDSLRDIMKQHFQGDVMQLADNLGHTNIITNGYVQQLYRYFRLSPFAQTNPFDLVAYMRDTFVYRLVVVGERAKRAINELIS